MFYEVMKANVKSRVECAHAPPAVQLANCRNALGYTGYMFSRIRTLVLRVLDNKNASLSRSLCPETLKALRNPLALRSFN